MKVKKKYLIFFAILFFYLIITFFLFRKQILNDYFISEYIVIDPSTAWKYKDGKWQDIDSFNEINMHSFHTYVNQDKMGIYNIVYNNKFYLFDKNKKSVRYNGSLFAYNGNMKIDVIQFKSEDLDTSDTQVIDKVIKENQVKFFDLNKMSGNKIKVDIDHDGTLEKIYTMYNVFSNTAKEESIYAFVFILKEDKIHYLYKKKAKSDTMYETMCTPYMQNIIDINKDNNYEFIVGCEYFNNLGTCNLLYDSQKNKFKVLKSC